MDEILVDENARGSEGLEKAAKVVTIDKDGDGDADVVVITEVSDAKALEELKWWQQGDAAMETVDAIEARQGNRRQREVLDQLEQWWTAALHGSFTAHLDAGDGDGGKDVSFDNDDGQGQLKALSRERYVTIFTKVRERARVRVP